MAKDKIAGVPVVPSTTVPDAVPVTTPGVGHSFNFAPPAPEPPKRTKPVSKGDPELQTMARIDRMLSAMPLRTQERIICWLQNRLVENLTTTFDQKCRLNGVTYEGYSNGPGVASESPPTGVDPK